jgi:ABC-2 type transport system permease protein
VTRGGVRAVLYKESLELRRMNVSKASTLVGVLLILGLFGFLSWVTYFAEPLAWGWVILVFMPVVPTFFVAFFAAESVVGERERHTLETLLASPLRGREVIFGKVALHFLVATALFLGLVLYVWLCAMLAAPSQGFPVPPPGALLAAFVLFSGMFLVNESIGIFVGQIARTVATATTVISPITALPLMGLIIFPQLLGDAPEEVVEARLAEIVWLIVGSITAIALLIAIPLLILALRRARPERLLA